MYNWYQSSSSYLSQSRIQRDKTWHIDRKAKLTFAVPMSSCMLVQPTKYRYRLRSNSAYNHIPGVIKGIHRSAMCTRDFIALLFQCSSLFCNSINWEKSKRLISCCSFEPYFNYSIITTVRECRKKLKLPYSKKSSTTRVHTINLLHHSSSTGQTVCSNIVWDTVPGDVSNLFERVTQK